ncbi:MAG: DUF3658 domain-containing protein [Intestinibacillus sp.]
MYWICFSDSAGGMLKGARRSCEPGLPLQHIIPLLDDLSQGDLTRLGNPEAREDTVCPWRNDPDIEDRWKGQALSRHFEGSLLALDTCGEAVIWYGDNAAERCGLLYAVSRLWPRGVPVWTVHVDQISALERQEPAWPDGDEGVVGYICARKNNGRPLWRPQWYLRWRIRRHVQKEYRRNRKENRVIHFASAAAIEPSDAAYFYQRRRRLTEGECRSMAAEWDALCRENAPLRVLQDGMLRSAGRDYFDGLILSEVPVHATGAATVIGNVLWRHDLYISDMLVYERLRGLIEQGKVRVVTDAPTYRELVVRRGG